MQSIETIVDVNQKEIMSRTPPTRANPRWVIWKY